MNKLVYFFLKQKPEVQPAEEVASVVSERDSSFIGQIMGLVRQEEEVRDIQPRVKTISAGNYIVATITSSGGRNPMCCTDVHDLRTNKGRDSFRACCQYGLLGILYFLEGTDPKQRSYYKSVRPNEFHRDDLEPWISLVGVIRKWDGHI